MIHSPAKPGSLTYIYLWVEPGQCPEFDEYTLVLKGALHVETREGSLVIHAGEALVTRKGELTDTGLTCENTSLEKY